MMSFFKFGVKRMEYKNKIYILIFYFYHCSILRLLRLVCVRQKNTIYMQFIINRKVFIWLSLVGFL